MTTPTLTDPTITAPTPEERRARAILFGVKERHIAQRFAADNPGYIVVHHKLQPRGCYVLPQAEATDWEQQESEAMAQAHAQFRAAWTTMNDTKTQMQQMVLAETLDLAVLDELHSQHIKSKRIVEDSYARAEEERQEREARLSAMRKERREAASTMSKRELLKGIGYRTEHDIQQGMKRTRQELIDSYANALPPGH